MDAKKIVSEQYKQAGFDLDDPNIGILKANTNLVCGFHLYKLFPIDEFSLDFVMCSLLILLSVLPPLVFLTFSTGATIQCEEILWAPIRTTASYESELGWKLLGQCQKINPKV